MADPETKQRFFTGVKGPVSDPYEVKRRGVGGAYDRRLERHELPARDALAKYGPSDYKTAGEGVGFRFPGSFKHRDKDVTSVRAVDILKEVYGSEGAARAELSLADAYNKKHKIFGGGEPGYISKRASERVPIHKKNIVEPSTLYEGASKGAIPGGYYEGQHTPTQLKRRDLDLSKLPESFHRKKGWAEKAGNFLNPFHNPDLKLSDISIPRITLQKDRRRDDLYAGTVKHEGRHHLTVETDLPNITKNLPYKGIVSRPKPKGLDARVAWSSDDYRHPLRTEYELTQGLSQLAGQWYKEHGHRPTTQELRDLFDLDKEVPDAWQTKGKGMWRRTKDGVDRGEAPGVIDSIRTWLKTDPERGKALREEILRIMPAIVQNKKRFFPEQGGEQMA